MWSGSISAVLRSAEKKGLPYPAIPTATRVLLILPAHHRARYDKSKEEHGRDHPSGERRGSLAHKFIIISFQIDHGNDQRQDIGHIAFQPSRKPNPLSCIRFFQKIRPAPAVFPCTEEHIPQAAQREQVIGYDKILQIQDIGSRSQRLKAGQDVKSQHAGHAQHNDQDRAHQHAFVPGPAENIDIEGYDIFKYSHNGRECRKGQKQKKQRAPDLPSRHLGKDIGNGDEDQARPRSRLNAEGEAGRNDDEACHQRHEGIQCGNADRLSREAPLFSDIAAEDHHRADTDGEGKECLAHGPEDHISDTHLLHLGKIRYQVEMDPFPGPFQKYGMYCQHQHDDQKRAHHQLGNPLNPLLDPELADRKTDDADQGCPERHHRRVAQHVRKTGCHCIRRRPGKFSCDAAEAVIHHPVTVH